MLVKNLGEIFEGIKKLIGKLILVFINVILLNDVQVREEFFLVDKIFVKLDGLWLDQL